MPHYDATLIVKVRAYSGVQLAATLGVEILQVEQRRFPDGESYVRLRAACRAKTVIVVMTLHRPDPKLLPLVFLCDLLRELGVGAVVLVAPYLAYMRQDKRFNPGEAVTAESFARLLSGKVDALLTVDPHLHRHSSLAELYSIPASVVHAAPLLADWIRAEVKWPLLIGPDSESEQWVADVAARAGCPHIALEKRRRGDRDVEISVPDVGRWPDRQPVLVDDIISTAQTMIGTVGHLEAAGMPAPICIGVHAVFAANSYKELLASGVDRVATTNTIPHETNEIEIADLLRVGLEDLLENSVYD